MAAKETVIVLNAGTSADNKPEPAPDISAKLQKTLMK